MASIICRDLCLTIPIFDYSNQSLRQSLVQKAVGGTINTSNSVSTVDALKKVNLEIVTGDMVGIVGHNGSGKSSFLRVLSGIYSPTSGSCEIDGTLLSIISLSDGLEPSLSGRENIYRVGLMRNIPLDFLREREASIIEFSELDAFIDLPVRTYSSGMSLRLVFSVLTAVNCDILVLDEFFAAGDAAFQEKAANRIKEMIGKAKVFVFASHSFDLIKQHCSRVFVFAKGEVTEENVRNI